MEGFTINEEVLKNLKRKGLKAGDIAIRAAMKQMGDHRLVNLSLGVGLVQGLKYRGNFRRGAKAALTTYGVITGAGVVMNVANNWDVIRNA